MALDHYSLWLITLEWVVVRGVGGIFLMCSSNDLRHGNLKKNRLKGRFKLVEFVGINRVRIHLHPSWASYSNLVLLFPLPSTGRFHTLPNKNSKIHKLPLSNLHKPLKFSINKSKKINSPSPPLSPHSEPCFSRISKIYVYFLEAWRINY